MPDPPTGRQMAEPLQLQRFSDQSRLCHSRVFLVLGSLITGLGVSAYLSARLHRTAGQKIVFVSFTLFTALVLPVLTFVLY